MWHQGNLTKYYRDEIMAMMIRFKKTKLFKYETNIEKKTERPPLPGKAGWVDQPIQPLLTT